MRRTFFLFFAPNENHTESGASAIPRVDKFRPRGDAVAYLIGVGELVEALDAVGKLENTLIIISSIMGRFFLMDIDGAIERQGSHDASGPWRGGNIAVGKVERGCRLL